MANLPSPVVGAGGAQRQNPGVQLLMALTQQLMGGLLQRGMNRVMPQPEAPPTQQELNRSGAEANAQSQLVHMPGQQENLAAKAAASSGLGNAAVPTKKVAGLSALPSAASTAPERLAAIQAQQAADEELATKARIRTRAISSTPEPLRGVMEMMLNAKEAGADASSINDILPRLLPPTEAEVIRLTKDKAELDEIQLKLRQAGRDANMRQTIASRMGLPVETVTDGMITEWMRQQDAARPDSPDSIAERILTTLVSRSVVDPITGVSNPAFSIEDAATRAEAAMQLFVPGYTMNLSPVQRDIATASGILRAAVAKLKFSEPGIKAPDIEAQLGPRFLADFPNIPPDIFQQLLTEAIKSNLLTGM